MRAPRTGANPSYSLGQTITVALIFLAAPVVLVLALSYPALIAGGVLTAGGSIFVGKIAYPYVSGGRGVGRPGQ